MTSVVCASRAEVRIEPAAPLPTAVSEASTSEEVSLSWAPTSEETPSSACCAARAPVWMVSEVLTTRLVSERSASSTCDLMPEESISARAIRSSLAWRPELSMRPATASTREPSRSSNCATRVSISEAIRPTRVSMPWWISWKRAEMVSVRCALRPLMVSVTAPMRWSTACTACSVPSVSEEVRWDSRESIEWMVCAAPSVSVVASEVRRESMVSVTDFARVSKFTSSDFRRLSIDSSNDLILPSSEVSSVATRLPSVVSNCSRRWSSEAVISPPLEVRRVSKLST